MNATLARADSTDVVVVVVVAASARPFVCPPPSPGVQRHGRCRYWPPAKVPSWSCCRCLPSKPTTTMVMVMVMTNGRQLSQSRADVCRRLGWVLLHTRRQRSQTRAWTSTRTMMLMLMLIWMTKTTLTTGTFAGLARSRSRPCDSAPLSYNPSHVPVCLAWHEPAD